MSKKPIEVEIIQEELPPDVAKLIDYLNQKIADSVNRGESEASRMQLIKDRDRACSLILSAMPPPRAMVHMTS